MVDPFAKLRRIRARRERLAAQLAAVDQERDDEIRALIAASERVKEIAETAGLHPQRVYQIRDGRR